MKKRRLSVRHGKGKGEKIGRERMRGINDGYIQSSALLRRVLSDGAFSYGLLRSGIGDEE